MYILYRNSIKNTIINSYDIVYFFKWTLFKHSKTFNSLTFMSYSYIKYLI